MVMDKVTSKILVLVQQEDYTFKPFIGVDSTSDNFNAIKEGDSFYVFGIRYCIRTIQYSLEKEGEENVLIKEIYLIKEAEGYY